MLLEIDAIRCSLGRWEDLEESRLIARSLATAMADSHLRAGHDVIVPQYLGRTEFIDTLDRLAQRRRGDFIEILLVDTEAAVADRFAARRVELSAAGRAHPQVDVNELSISTTIAEAFERLRAVAAQRRRTQVIAVTDGLEHAHRALCRELGEGR